MMIAQPGRCSDAMRPRARQGSGSGISSECPPATCPMARSRSFASTCPIGSIPGPEMRPRRASSAGSRDKREGMPGTQSASERRTLRLPKAGAVCIKLNTWHVTRRENREFRSGHPDARALARVLGPALSRGGLWQPDSTLKLHIGVSDLIQTRAVTPAQAPTGRGWA
jgi:hypothetical protein